MQFNYFYFMAEMVRAEKELSDWFLNDPNFPKRTANVGHSRKVFTKSYLLEKF